MEYEALASLGRKHPAQLVMYVRQQKLTAFERSMAVECLGYIEDDRLSMPLLFEFLESKDPILREGAVHGLGHYLHLPSIRPWLEKIAAVDDSVHVRAAAEMVL